MMFGITNYRFIAKTLAICLVLFTHTACEKLNGLDYNKLDVKNPAIVKAFSEAKKNNKPVLLIFEADWCPYCARMNSETLIDADVKKSLEGYEFVQIDIDETPDVAKIFKGGPASVGGKGIPATVIFSPRGWEQFRVEGFLEPKIFNKLLKEFL